MVVLLLTFMCLSGFGTSYSVHHDYCQPARLLSLPAQIDWSESSHLTIFISTPSIYPLPAYAPQTVRANDAEEDDLAAEIAAEEAAAAAVEEEAEDEEDVDADALDEDADSARYDPTRRHPLSDLPPPSSDVSVGHSFVTGMSVDNGTSRSVVVLGEPIKSVIGFANNGRTALHVWGVMGSLNHDNRFSVYVQNFSYAVVNKTVFSGEELSLSYEFTPNAHLDIRPFQLAITMFYEAQSSSGNAIRGHSTTFFNSTIVTKPGSGTMSNGLFMLFFFIAIAAAFAAWYVWKNLESSAQKVEAVETGTSESSKNEWLEEHHNLTRTGGGRAKLKPDTKK